MNNKKFNIEDFKKQEPFKVPDQYFEQLKEKTLAQTQTKTVSIFRKQSFYYAVAASVSLFVLSFVFYQNVKTTATPECQELLCNVTDDEIYEYLYQNPSKIETNEVIENIENENTILFDPNLTIEESDIDYENISNFENI